MNPYNGLSIDHTNRIISEIVETQRQIAREMAYLPHNRKMDDVARWTAHLVKLQNMLGGINE